ncbi:hypothetical protein BH23GEM5_BH23GEM5_02310 [soil metagenome]
MKFLRGISLLLLLVFVVGAPLWLAGRTGVTPELMVLEKLVPLLAAFLVSTAFVTSLYTSFSNDKRLRSTSGKVLVALIWFAVAILLLAVALLLTALGILPRVAETATYAGMILYFCTFAYLLVGVFLPTYNQVYNLRTNKLYKHFPPISTARAIFAKDKGYEVNPPERRATVQFGVCETFLTAEERDQLGHGGAVLLTGVSTHDTLTHILHIIEERIRLNETVNYVCCDRHPYEVWKMLRGSLTQDLERLRKSLVFVDGYSPSFAFTDDIQRENDERLKADGGRMVKARSFAGLHTATNKAFNITKEDTKKGGVRKRGPLLMVYANTSALCDFESAEQFRVFWRHVIPSERSYGMTTFIIEDEHAGDEILGPLKQRVDFVLTYHRADDGVVTIRREK